MSTLELRTSTLEHLAPAINKLATHSLWVCFLNEDGYEDFIEVRLDPDDGTIRSSAPLPKDPTVSTIQFWRGEDRLTFLPVGTEPDGTPLFASLEEIVEEGVVPDFTVASLALRAQKQPYNRYTPESPIYPLLQLPPFTDQSSPQAS